MATATKANGKSSVTRLMDSIEGIEQSSLDSVRRFLESVDGALPALSDDAPRRKIINAAFDMVEQLVDASNNFTRNVVKTTEDALGVSKSSTSAAAK